MASLVVDQLGAEITDGTEKRPKHPELKNRLAKPRAWIGEKTNCVIQASSMWYCYFAWKHEKHLSVPGEAIGQLYTVFPKSVGDKCDP